jgi:polyisoprenoid-binding protein YceI
MKKFILAAALTLLPLSTLADGKGEADVSLTPAGDFKAKVDDVKGFATMKDGGVMAENVVVNLKTIETGIALRDKHAREKYLEVEKYPEMTLVKAVGKGGKGKGLIKYRGVQKEVQGTYSVEGDTLKANFPIKLSEFNITGVKYMGVGVDDEVKIQVELPLKK